MAPVYNPAPLVDTIAYNPRLDGWRPSRRLHGSLLGVAEGTLRSTNALALHEPKLTRTGRKLGATLPGAVDLREWCSPVENQGEVGSCVGNAVAGALEFLLIRDGLPAKDFSRLFIYYNARRLAGEEGRDDGSYISLAFRSLADIGVCEEKFWPYDTARVLERPDVEAYRQSYTSKIHNMFCIPDEGDWDVTDAMIKRTLENDHVVVFGMKVDDDYKRYTGGILSMPADLSARPNPGGHCQMIVGYRDDLEVWIVRNSWGEGWGVGGHAYVPYDYLHVSDASDFWVPYRG